MDFDEVLNLPSFHGEQEKKMTFFDKKGMVDREKIQSGISTKLVAHRYKHFTLLLD